jgi:glutathione-independent formaldehyde dehydrogenase
MKALIYTARRQMAVEEVENPRLEQLGDALVRITSSGICGSDLHMYDGRTDMETGRSFGHEILGVVEKVGEGVISIREGDRVVLPFNVSCGFCFDCARGFYQACLTTNPEGVGGAYGYADMGPHPGGQAEFIRVPFADFNCLKLPGRPGDEFEDDFVLLADVFPTGMHAAVLAKVQPGNTVAVFGAGPVGLLSAYSALLLGAMQVFVVDQSAERLRRAEKIGAIPINFRETDPVAAIREAIGSNPLVQESLRPEEKKLQGVMCGIDAVGYQAVSRQDPHMEDPTQVLRDLAQVVNPTGSIGIIGVYAPQDPGGRDEDQKKGLLKLPLGELWQKGISIGMGQCPVRRYDWRLRDLILAGRAKPSFIVSHRIGLDEAPAAYAKFDLRGTGEGEPYTKVIIKNI